MIDLTLDFETYFDTQVSIKKLSPLEYVRHPQFKVHGASIKINDKPAWWLLHTELVEFFKSIDWPNTRVISHNSNFDLLVLHEHYGIHPGDRVDTLGLCRALLPRDLDLSLDKIAPMLGFSSKVGGGAALQTVKGVEHPTHEQLDALGEYAIGDADNCYGIYKTLYPELPDMERRMMNLTLRMSTQGVFERDDEALAALADARQDVLDDRKTRLSKVPYTAAQLRSRDQFAQILVDNGIDPPIKRSPANGKPTYAFSKQDPDYVALKADPKVGDIVQARMAVASNNAITRIERIERILNLPPHTLPVLLNFNGAHTGRLSGGGKINSQNLNARGVGSGLRKGLRVRDRYVVIVKDQSGVELRMNMCYSEQHDILAAINRGEDVYIQEAANQLNILEELVTTVQRQFGKVIRLGAQYGMGPPRFRIYVAAGPLGMDPMHLTADEAFQTIMGWRGRHQHVVNTWHWLNDIALPQMASKGAEPLVRGPTTFEFEQLRLPNGLCLTYPNLTATEAGWTWGMQSTNYIWGGTMLENIIQALAGIIIKDQMVEIDDRLNGDAFIKIYQQPQFGNPITAESFEQLKGKAAVIHQVHDEILTLCRAEDAEDIMKEMDDTMTRPVDWAPGLKLEVKGDYAQEYSK